MSGGGFDDETLKIMFSYGGRDPRIATKIEVEALYEYKGEWTLKEFEELISDAIASIPEECRESAIVELGGDECSYLKITFCRLQTSEEVAADVARAFDYAKKCQASERATFDRLKQKFG
jgi:hypothetical protein